MLLGQSDFLGNVAERPLLGCQQDRVGTFDQPDRLGGRAHPLLELLFFLLGEQDNQGGFAPTHGSLLEPAEPGDTQSIAHNKGIREFRPPIAWSGTKTKSS